MNLQEMIEWLSKRTLAPNLAVYRDGLRQCIEALKSIEPLRDRVNELEVENLALKVQMKESLGALNGCLTYDPMVDKYKLKQYHEYTIKPLRDRLAAAKEARGQQPQ